MFINSPQLRSPAAARTITWSTVLAVGVFVAPFDSGKICALTGSESESAWTKERRQARAAWSDGDYDDCARHLRQALSLSEKDRSNPAVSARNCCQSLVDLARVYLTQHKLTQTIEACDRCLNFATNNDLSGSSLCVHALIMRAHAYSQSHNSQAALSDLGSARELAQRCGASARDMLEEIEVTLGQELGARWRFAESRQAFLRALALIEHSAPAHRQLMLPSLYLSLCQLDVSQRSWEEGSKHGQQAIDGYLRRDPHSNGSTINSARVYTAYCCLHLGERERAQKLLDQVFSNLSSIHIITLLKQTGDSRPIHDCLLSAAPLCDTSVAEQCRQAAQRLR